MQTYNRIYYLDILKFVAILAVILVHVSAPYAIQEINSLNYWVGHSVDSMFRFGTLVFVMITGALLLDDQYTFSFKKNWFHILRFFICFVVWSLLYVTIYEIIVPAIKGLVIISFDNFVRYFFKGHLHLWYLVMAIGLYLIIPLLRLWVKKENKKYVEYFLILAIVFCSFLPMLLDILNLFKIDLYNINKFLDYASISYVIGYVPFLVLGWYLHNYNIKKEIIIHIFAILSLVITIAGSWFISTELNRHVLLYSGTYITIGLMSTSVFLIGKRCFADRSPKTKWWSWNISFIAKHSLGFYASHVGFCYMFSRIIERNWTDNALIVIPICFIGGFVLSYLLTLLLSFIPYIKKIV